MAITKTLAHGDDLGGLAAARRSGRRRGPKQKRPDLMAGAFPYLADLFDQTAALRSLMSWCRMRSFSE